MLEEVREYKKKNKPSRERKQQADATYRDLNRGSRQARDNILEGKSITGNPEIAKPVAIPASTPPQWAEEWAAAYPDSPKYSDSPKPEPMKENPDFKTDQKVRGALGLKLSAPDMGASIKKSLEDSKPRMGWDTAKGKSYVEQDGRRKYYSEFESQRERLAEKLEAEEREQEQKRSALAGLADMFSSIAALSTTAAGGSPMDVTSNGFYARNQAYMDELRAERANNAAMVYQDWKDKQDLLLAYAKLDADADKTKADREFKAGQAELDRAGRMAVAKTNAQSRERSAAIAGNNRMAVKKWEAEQENPAMSGSDFAVTAHGVDYTWDDVNDGLEALLDSKRGILNRQERARLDKGTMTPEDKIAIFTKYYNEIQRQLELR